MRDVGHQNGTHRVRDIRKALEVNMQRISRSSGNDQLGLMFLGKTLDFVIVNSLGVIANA